MTDDQKLREIAERVADRCVRDCGDGTIQLRGQSWEEIIANHVDAALREARALGRASGWQAWEKHRNTLAEIIDRLNTMHARMQREPDRFGGYTDAVWRIADDIRRAIDAATPLVPYPGEQGGGVADEQPQSFAELNRAIDREQRERMLGASVSGERDVGRYDRPHLIDGEFQSDKYPTCPRGKVPLSTKDLTAQDLLWEYAQRRRSVDAEFADDLEEALRLKGYTPPTPDVTREAKGCAKWLRARYERNRRIMGDARVPVVLEHHEVLAILRELEGRTVEDALKGGKRCE